MRKFILLALCVSSLALALALAAPLAHGQEPAKAIAPLIDEDTILIIHVSLTDFNLSVLLDQGEMLGLFDDRESKKRYQHWLLVHKRFTKAGGRELFLLAGLANLPDLEREPPTLAVPLEDGADVDKLAELLKETLPTAEVAKVGRFLVAAEKSDLERLRKIQPKARPELTQAFLAAGEGSIRLVFLPPPELLRAIDETLPMLPKVLGGASSKTLTKNVRWLAAGLDLRNDGELRVILQAADADTAQTLRQMARTAIDVGLRGFARRLTQEFADKPIDDKELDKALAQLQISVKAAQVILAIPQNPAVQKLGGAIGQTLSNSRARIQGVNNLKQIGLAFHHFHSYHGRFPGNIVDRNGKALLSLARRYFTLH